LSAGRVQSVAVRLIVEREDEIKNFKVTSSYKVVAKFEVENNKGKAKFIAELPKRFKTKKKQLNFWKGVKMQNLKFQMLKRNREKNTPAPPFTTSTLQQEASRKLGFSVRKYNACCTKVIRIRKDNLYEN